jgi:hypothetical protein
MRSRLVLPAPFGPVMYNRLPALTEKLTCSNNNRSPFTRDKLWALSTTKTTLKARIKVDRMLA